MERNWVLLMGFFLLLVAVDCSSSDPKVKVNEKSRLNQNLDGTVTVDPVKGNDDSKSVSDSSGIKNLKDNNGGDQINGSNGDTGSDTSSNLNQQSGSNEGEKLLKDGKDSIAEAHGKTDAGKQVETEHKGGEDSHFEAGGKGGKAGGGKGDNEHQSQEEPLVDAGGKANGGKSANEQKGKEESQFEAGGSADNGRGDNEHKGNKKPQVEAGGNGKGDNEHKGQEESHVEAGGKTDVEKSDNELKGQGQESNGITDGVKEGNNEHKGHDDSNLETKGKSNGVKVGNNLQKNLEESKLDDKGNTKGDNKGNNVKKGQEESKFEPKGKTDDVKKGNLNDSEDIKEVKSEKDETHDLVLPPPPPTWKDGFRGEECDPSNMCMDKNKQFAACLRVPGNESPDLSLLIQNKGERPLVIEISAPAFVQLEETNVVVRGKKDRKVKVSIKDSGIGNLIVLKSGSGECSLDFKDLILHNSATSYVNFLSQTPTTAFIFFAAIMILASGWMCMSFRRRLLASNGSKYRKLDMELPVSVVAKVDPDVNDDGWDNSWGDDWDDEEAPMTPSMPVTPSLSSKGLASRRLNKEGWKD